MKVILTIRVLLIIKINEISRTCENSTDIDILWKNFCPFLSLFLPFSLSLPFPFPLPLPFPLGHSLSHLNLLDFHSSPSPSSTPPYFLVFPFHLLRFLITFLYPSLSPLSLLTPFPSHPFSSLSLLSISFPLSPLFLFTSPLLFSSLSLLFSLPLSLLFLLVSSSLFPSHLFSSLSLLSSFPFSLLFFFKSPLSSLFPLPLFFLNWFLLS